MVRHAPAAAPPLRRAPPGQCTTPRIGRQSHRTLGQSEGRMVAVSVCSSGLRAACVRRASVRSARPVVCLARPSQKQDAPKKEVQLNSTLAPSECRRCPACLTNGPPALDLGHVRHAQADALLAGGNAPPCRLRRRCRRRCPGRCCLPRLAPIPSIRTLCPAVAALAAINPLADFLQGQAGESCQLGAAQGCCLAVAAPGRQTHAPMHHPMRPSQTSPVPPPPCRLLQHAEPAAAADPVGPPRQHGGRAVCYGCAAQAGSAAKLLGCSALYGCPFVSLHTTPPTQQPAYLPARLQACTAAATWAGASVCLRTRARWRPPPTCTPRCLLQQACVALQGCSWAAGRRGAWLRYCLWRRCLGHAAAPAACPARLTVLTACACPCLRMQLAVGMGLFFALGALGGSMSMLMQAGGCWGFCLRAGRRRQQQRRLGRCRWCRGRAPPLPPAWTWNC